MIRDRLPGMLLCASVIIITFSQTMKSKEHADAKAEFFKWVKRHSVFFLPLLEMEVCKAEEERRETTKC